MDYSCEHITLNLKSDYLKVSMKQEVDFCLLSDTEGLHHGYWLVFTVANVKCALHPYSYTLQLALWSVSAGISVVLDLTPNYQGSSGPWFSNISVTNVAERLKVNTYIQSHGGDRWVSLQICRLEGGRGRTVKIAVTRATSETWVMSCTRCRFFTLSLVRKQISEPVNIK